MAELVTLFTTIATAANTLAQRLRTLKAEASARQDVKLENIALQAENGLLDIENEIKRLQREVEDYASVVEERDSLADEVHTLRSTISDLEEKIAQFTSESDNEMHLDVLDIAIMMCMAAEGASEGNIAIHLGKHRAIVSQRIEKLKSAHLIDEQRMGVGVDEGGVVEYLSSKGRDILIAQGHIK